MYELEGLGARLQQLRKLKNITQEDLAHRIGVTGQAVSKWETGQSYPDITLITTLATILETDIQYLFGKKTATPVNSFPEKYEGMPMVHSTKDVACYSNKAVISVDATGVKFADGSTAELSNKLAVNHGVGEIRFLGDGSDYYGSWHDIDHSITSMDKEFGFTDNIDLTVSCRCKCSIVPSKDGKTRVKATGDAIFIRILDAAVSDKTLKISQKPTDNYNSSSSNMLIVEMPCNTGGYANITINGSSDIVSEIAKFNTGDLRINGSGTIRTQSFDSCTTKINGSGEITLVSATALTVGISGSGTVDVNEMTGGGDFTTKISGSGSICVKSGSCNGYDVKISGSGSIDTGSLTVYGTLNIGISGSGAINVNEMAGGGDFSTKISGSGSICIKSGNCDKFGADVSGSCDIDAIGLTVREANIILHSDGNVTLGRVLERSSEQIKKKGTIQVLKRGSDN